MVHPQLCIMQSVNDWISQNIPGDHAGNLSSISEASELTQRSLGPGYYMCCKHIPEENGEHVDILEKHLVAHGGVFYNPSYSYCVRARFFLVVIS